MIKYIISYYSLQTKMPDLSESAGANSVHKIIKFAATSPVNHFLPIFFA